MLTCDTHQSGTLTVVTVAGEVDLAHSNRLWRALRPHIGPSKQLIIDCSNVTFIDSMGLNVLVLAKTRADAINMRLDLSRPSPALQRALELAGAAEMFTTTGEQLHAGPPPLR